MANYWPGDSSDQSLNGPDTIPLVVDVDGSLVSTNLLWEGIVRLAFERPVALILAIPHLMRGRAPFKAYIARKASLDMDMVPLNDSVRQLIRRMKSEGRDIVLASAAHDEQVAALAGRVGATAAIASDGDANLRGANKLEAISKRYGEFDYVGDSVVDFPILRSARHAYLVDPGLLLRYRSGRERDGVTYLQSDSGSLASALIRALRPWQWSKNALLLLPIFAAQHAWSSGFALRVAAGIGAFSLVASSLYLVNDLSDLPHDRAHSEKRKRPLAAGKLPIPYAILAVIVCLLGALLLSVPLPDEFLLVLGLYAVLNAAYSFDLKRRLILDVIVLASLYTLRVVAGAAVAQIELSEWFLAFSIFFFLSLGILKRVVELAKVTADELSGRAYEGKDSEVLIAIGPAAAVMSALVYCLYITGPHVRELYSHPQALWLGLPLFLYWSVRVWVLGVRGKVDDDPVVFVLRDRVSWLAVAAFFAMLLLAA